MTRTYFVSLTGDDIDMQFEASPALLITCGVTAIAAAVLGIYSATMLQRPILFIVKLIAANGIPTLAER